MIKIYFSTRINTPCINATFIHVDEIGSGILRRKSLDLTSTSSSRSFYSIPPSGHNLRRAVPIENSVSDDEDNAGWQLMVTSASSRLTLLYAAKLH